MREQHARAMGGKEKLEKRHEKGFMNARERIDYLFDQGSFIESGLHARAINPEVRAKSPADGKIAGYGRIDGQEASIVANDFTVLGASSSVINMKKMRHMKEMAIKKGIPWILLGESTGARMPDRMGAPGRATMGQDPTEYRRMREVPMVTALLGECYGSSTWYTVISDIRIMRKGAHMAVASSRVTSIAINQPVDPEELGGWRLHAETTGLVDMVVDDDRQALDAIKKVLSYLPPNSQQPPPECPIAPGSGEESDRLLEVIPDKSNRVYNVLDVLKIIYDKDSLLELKPRFGTSLVTALARLDGKTVGIIANNPKFLSGSIDVNAMKKATSFLVFCDSFNIPLVFMVDQPGFLIGIEGERRGAPGQIMNWMNALQLVTVPKITVIMRKDYGQAYLNMCGGRNADEVLLWPTADLGFMGPAVGVNVLHNVKQSDDPKKFEELKAQIERDTSAYALAELYEGHMVLDPRQTRPTLIRLLEGLRYGRNGGVGEHLLRNWPTSY
jgi:methylmalonyl-CoA decarboxylase subunit alpha